MSHRDHIVVVGSSNMDLVVRAPRLPSPGETLAGSDFRTIPGGKGANQAVAAARLGGRVSLVGAVGDDAFGATLREGLERDGIDVSHVRTASATPTGIAIITVGGDGANTIVLAPGANAALSPASIDACAPMIAGAAMLVCQLEIPLATVAHAVRLAADARTPVLLNPAPAIALPDDLLRDVDYLVPNETEAALLGGARVADPGSAREAARALRARGPRHVIVTLGALGVWLESEQDSDHLAAPVVSAVDTTAAGDTFIGGFAASLAAGADVRTAIAFGQRAAALSVTRAGAQTSIPYRSEVDNVAAA
ncbi:MAG: ribokinase [Burkholderiales bacterium]